MPQQIWLLWFEDKYNRQEEILWHKFILIQCEFMELSNLVFVAMVTTFKMAAEIFANSVSLTASINQIKGSRLK